MSNKPEIKLIRFKSLKSRLLVAETQLPSVVPFVSASQSQQVYWNIEGLSSQFRLLFTDLIFRGFHSEAQRRISAKDVFEIVTPENLEKQNEAQCLALLTCQAIAISWRCLGQEIGMMDCKGIQIDRVQGQIKRIIKQVKRGYTEEKRNQVNEQKVQQYLQILQNIKKLQGKLELQITRIRQEQERATQKYIFNRIIIKRVIEQQIISLEKEVFIKSLVAIKRLESDGIFQFIFQQSYPSLIFSKVAAIQILGSNLFSHKICKYEKIINQTHSQYLVICHKCLCLISQSRQYFCKDQWAVPLVTHTVLTDPYIYWKKIINKGEEEGPKKSFIHPYLIYYNLDNKDSTPICNRFFCEKCYSEETSMQQKGNCPYCEGTCSCPRCDSMDVLTKMMGVYYDNGGDLQKLANKFLLKFDKKRLAYKTKIQTMKNEKKSKDYENYYKLLKYSNIFKKDVQNFEHTKYFPQCIYKSDWAKVEKQKRRRIFPKERKFSKKVGQPNIIDSNSQNFRHERREQPSESEFQIDSSYSN